MKLFSNSQGAVRAALVAAVGLASGLLTHASAAEPTPAARVIVKYKSSSPLVSALSVGKAEAQSVGDAHAQALSNRLGIALTAGRSMDARTQVLKASGVTSAVLAERLARYSDVEYAVVDHRRHAFGVPNDPRYAGGQTSVTPAVGQWYLHAPDTSAVAAIDAEGAWSLATGKGVVVAVLDTGVRFNHPDLTAKLYPGYDFIQNTFVGNDQSAADGDPSDPGDWFSSADFTAGGDEFSTCTVEDSSWHGTQTAGLVGAAGNNGIGIAGSGADVMVLPLRVLGKCGGYDSDIISAMKWGAGLTVPNVPANAHPAKVINMSLGSAAACDAAYSDAISAVTAAGAVIVVSAGNDGLAVNAPANCAGVIAVAGVRHSGTKVGYSSLGPQVTVAAPAGNCVNETGTCLYSMITTTNAGTTSPGLNTYSDGLNTSLGTSFSAPLVSGTVALMFSANPALTPAQVAAKLKETARPFPAATLTATPPVAACHAPDATPQDAECACTTTTCGAGLLDARAAVASVAAVTNPLIPVISFDTTKAVTSGTVTLDSARSTVPSDAPILTYQWAVVSGPATLTSTTSTAATATLKPSASGPVVVSLTVTNARGSSTREITMAVDGITATRTAPTVPQSGGGGGGALSFLWLAGLASAVLLLQLARVHQARLKPISLKTRR